jgi:D-alanyl-D-alanine carboxypeptidase
VSPNPRGLRRRDGSTVLVVLLLLWAGCGDSDGSEARSGEPSTSLPASTSSLSEQPAAFPTDVFAAIDEHPLPADRAEELQAVLAEAAGPYGLTATVMSASGTWTGAVGKADQQLAMRPDAQMAIGSITKSIIAAQVMQLVEAGELSLDDPVADHLPVWVDLDTNQATIRHLVSMRSGIPDHVDALWDSLFTDRLRRWTPGEVLELVGPTRRPPGELFEYSNTNYVLLGLMVEHVGGRALGEVLRSGVLAGDGLARLVFQPDERTSPPMAMPSEETGALDAGGGYLPSLAAVSAAGGAGAMASDSASLARWWARFCSGQVVSQASLDEMTASPPGNDGYGLGLMDEHGLRRQAIGHEGLQVGFAAWATCLPEDGLVVVVLTNHEELVTGEVVDALADAAASWG